MTQLLAQEPPHKLIDMALKKIAEAASMLRVAADLYQPDPPADTVLQALELGVCVRFEYPDTDTSASPSGSSIRHIHPSRFDDARGLVNGWDFHRGAPRSFKIDRMRDVELAPGPPRDE